jgi:hypothetical protein
VIPGLLVLAACSKSVPAGPMGEPIELRQYLPESLRLRATEAADSSFRQLVAVGPDSAAVEVVWSSFAHDSGRYLATISARLVRPAPYDSLRLGAVVNLTNVGSRWKPIESGTTQILWYKGRSIFHRRGVIDFGFDAAGRRTLGPSHNQTRR